MPLQGLMDPDHIPVNKFELSILGLGTVTFTKVSGLEIEIPAIDLPDRTRATGGQKNATEITVEVPMHHTDEIAIMDSWFDDAQDPVDPEYKKSGTLQHLSNTRDIIKEYSLSGVWCSKRKLSDLDMANDGDMAIAEYTLQVDIVTPVA